jgi:hypothetical protein
MIFFNLPDRILNEPRKTGGPVNSLTNIKKQFGKCYTFIKWVPEGIPQEEN